MRTLVTGAGGFAGQHLIAALLERGGSEIWGGALDGAAPAPGVLTEEELARVAWIPLDITSPESAREAISDARPERVYHLAGQSSVSGSFADPLGTWDVNATGTLRLLEALSGVAATPVEAGRGGENGDGGPGLAARGTRVLVVSSAEVYGAVPENRQPIVEDEPLRPITPYGASKMAAEAAALQASAAGQLHVVVARSFNHAGPGQDERFALPSMARQLAEMLAGGGEPVLRVGNLTPLRDFLDVRDVVRAYVTLLERGENGGVYNVCSGESLSMTEIVEALVRISGTGARIEVDPERFRPVEIPLLIGDCSRLRALGWSAGIPLERTLTDLLESAGALTRAAPGAGR
jgi:GDP-4-dehydro-6-deoxy-D-mannose reductase